MTVMKGARGEPGAPFFLSHLAGRTARVSSLSHLRDRNVRRILSLVGVALKLGWPKRDEHVAVWGNARTTARRGAAMAARTGATCLFLEDAFLRSVRPGAEGTPIHGLLLDTQRPYYDSSGPSDLEHLLATDPLGETERGAALIAALRRNDLSKYNCHDPDLSAPEPGYVLVVDQIRGDASIAGAGADADRFHAMYVAAKQDHPDRPILIRGHPVASDAGRPGHFPDATTTPVSPWRLLAGAHAVYTVSSQLGFEAILAGHRPQVFGAPFYAGWGLSDDRVPVARRGRQLTPEQLALGALVRYPVWYDPCRDRLCTVETVLDLLATRARAWREDHQGAVAHGMRLWKRPSLTRMFGDGPLCFVDDPDKAIARARKDIKPILSWASRTSPDLVRKTGNAGVPLVRIEDGLVRSKGLGAALIPPLSLVRDRSGIYYDPAGPNDLEVCITAAAARGASPRGKALLARLQRSAVSKYNLDLPAYARPRTADAPVILVVGQVVDDASVVEARAGAIRDTEGLLAAARAAHPDAYLVLKPHPDVEAGLRDGVLQSPLPDEIAEAVDPISVLLAADEVWTLSSLLGFEALLRGRKVVCAGVPFYAGWGLTEDLAPHDHPAFKRRSARPDLAALVEAVLIDYPRYHDPISNLPCTVEVILDRLESSTAPVPNARLRILSKLQGMLASRRGLWR